MKMIRLLTLLTILSILLTGCTGERATKDAMKNAEALMEESPDSALTILKSMPQEKLITKELKARYSLLYAMALDKNYIDTTNLDVISPAIEYYSRYGSPIEKMKTYFYQGCIYANRRENDRAMYCWQLSLDDSLNVDDNHYKSLINSAISVIYSRNRNYEQELYYTREALKYERMAGDSVGIWAITGHLAACYANMQMYEDADRVYDEFFSMHIYDSLKYARRRLNYAKDLIRRETKRPAQSIEIIEDVAKTFPKAMTVEAYCIYAYALQISGNSDAASSIIQQLEAMNGSTDIIRVWRYRICREQGQYKQAIEDLEHSIMVQDSVILASIQQSLLRTQRDYLNAKTELLKKENKIVRQKIYLTVVVSFVLLGGLFFLYIRRRASYSKRIEELSSLYLASQQMLDLQNLKTDSLYAQLAEKDSDILSLRKKYATMYKAQYKTLNDLCAAYLSPIKKDRKEVLYDEAMRQLDIIINDRESQDKFMVMVNCSLDNIIDKLRMDLPNHKDQDFRFLMFIIVGFDATTIANLTGYSVGTVYTKKNRLKGEIANLSSPHKDFYLRYIC